MIEILLSVYNGEKHLEEQLESLLSQDYKDTVITVRNDCSTDGTVDILNRYIDKYPQKIRMITTPSNGHSTVFSYGELMKNANASSGTYYAICGQGDVWKPTKLTAELTALKALEAQTSPRTPILVHCDAEICDSGMGRVSTSLADHANLRTNNFTLKQALAENPVIDETCLMNQALLNLCRNISGNAVSIGWWIALNAAAFGKVGYCRDALVRKRFSGTSEIEACAGKDAFLAKHTDLLKGHTFETKKSYYQAQEFVQANENGLTDANRAIASGYAAFISANKFVKMSKILFGVYRKMGFFKVLGQLSNC